MLLETPNISQQVGANWMRKLGSSGNDFTEMECRVVAQLANLLRPFIPKRKHRPDGQGLESATAMSLFGRQQCVASLHGLQLGAVVLYETFCSQNA
ncbi:hypothetical protein BGZ65_010734, partial [Modicella reniformis]